MRDSIFEYFGAFAIFGAAAILILLIQRAFGIPEIVQALTQLSPWAGANARTLSYAAVGMVFATAVAIPPILLLKDSNDGGSRLRTLGFAVWAALLFPAIGFLLFVGWFGAKHILFY